MPDVGGIVPNIGSFKLLEDGLWKENDGQGTRQNRNRRNETDMREDVQEQKRMN